MGQSSYAAPAVWVHMRFRLRLGRRAPYGVPHQKRYEPAVTLLGVGSRAELDRKATVSEGVLLSSVISSVREPRCPGGTRRGPQPLNFFSNALPVP